MKEKIVILLLLLCFIATIGRSEYVNCFTYVKEYYHLRTNVKSLEEKKKDLKTNNSLVAKDLNTKYNKYDNIVEFCEKITQMSGCSVEEYAALKIVNSDNVMYIARTKELKDVSAFSKELNGLQLTMQVDDLVGFLHTLSDMGLLIYAIDCDTETNTVLLKLLII